MNYFAVGGKLKIGTLQKILKNGYAKEKEKEIDGYHVDPSLSGNRTQVLHNADKNHTIVAHKGTDSATDWVTNLRYGLFNDKSSNRFKHAKKIQREAEDKYKDGTFTTIGHSLGSKLSTESATKGDIITLNGATTPFDIGKKVPKNQTNIRTSYDPVSALQRYQSKNGNEVDIRSDSINPLTEHSTDTLSRVDPDTEVGSSINPHYYDYYC